MPPPSPTNWTAIRASGAVDAEINPQKDLHETITNNKWQVHIDQASSTPIPNICCRWPFNGTSVTVLTSPFNCNAMKRRHQRSAPGRQSAGLGCHASLPNFPLPTPLCRRPSADARPTKNPAIQWTSAFAHSGSLFVRFSSPFPVAPSHPDAVHLQPACWTIRSPTHAEGRLNQALAHSQPVQPLGQTRPAPHGHCQSGSPQ
jgi:hypothetical protein